MLHVRFTIDRSASLPMPYAIPLLIQFCSVVTHGSRSRSVQRMIQRYSPVVPLVIPPIILQHYSWSRQLPRMIVEVLPPQTILLILQLQRFEEPRLFSTARYFGARYLRALKRRADEALGWGYCADCVIPGRWCRYALVLYELGSVGMDALGSEVIAAHRSI